MIASILLTVTQSLVIGMSMVTQLFSPRACVKIINTCRETGIKVAESVSRVAPTRAAGTSSPVHAASPDGTLTSRVGTRSTAAAKKATPAATKKATPAPTKKAAPAIAKMSTPATTKKATPAAAKKATPAAPKNQSTATPKNQSTAAPKKATPAARAANRRTAEPKKAAPMATDSATGVHDATSRSPTRSDTSSNDSVDADSDDSSGDWPSPVTFSAKGTADSSMEIDRSVSPADTVKKRRRTAAWKIGADGPTIFSVPDDEGDERSRKRNSQMVMPGKARRARSGDMSLEKLIESWKGGITGFGQKFKNVYEFRDALQKYAIAHHFVYRLKKNDSSCVSARCVAEGCSWRIHAAWVPSAKSFRIKKFDNLHTCNGESWKSAHPAKNWLVNIIKDRLRESPDQKPKDIANGILHDFGIELTYTKVWRGIVDAREHIQGPCKEAYDKLSGYCEKIKETNPGSITNLVIGDDKRFQCIFISFHASINGFLKGCRPLIFLEAASLKSKHQEVLLTATALDGDDGFFPIAFAIVDVENDDKWNWFLEKLKSALPTSEPITFVSDREKGLKESVLKVFENAYCGYSMYHLLESLQKNAKPPFHGDGKGSLRGYFVAAAHALRLVGLKKFTEQIKHISSQAYDWVMQIEPESWTTTTFKGERHNQITENVAEPYNKLLEESRELPITQKIDALISMMTRLINSRQTDSSKWSTKLTPSKMVKLQEEAVDSRGLKVFISSDTIFEVRDDVSHVVNLNNWDCTCLVWKTTGLPCRHAIAVFSYAHKSVYNYCSSYFTVDTFRLTYSESINPVPGFDKIAEKEEDVSDTEDVLPPCPSQSLSHGKPNKPKKGV